MSKMACRSFQSYPNDQMFQFPVPQGWDGVGTVYKKKVWDKVKASRDPAGTKHPCLLCTFWHWLLVRLCFNKLLKRSKTICFCVTTQQKQCCINVSLGLACARYPVHSGSRPTSLSATSSAPPCLSTIFRSWVFVCAPTGCSLLFCVLSACACRSEITVNLILHPSFVSHRGVFHSNHRPPPPIPLPSLRTLPMTTMHAQSRETEHLFQGEPPRPKSEGA